MAVKTKEIIFTNVAISVKATKRGSYRTINGYQGVTLGIPNNALITDISTVKTGDYFSIATSGSWSAQLRITNDAKNISNQLNVPYFIHSHSYGNVISSAPKVTLDFINQYSAHFDTQLFYFYLQGYVSDRDSLSITCQTNTRMIISYIEPAPVITVTEKDRTGFYSVDNPVWDKNNSRADIYVKAKTYNNATIASYHYEYWYGERTDTNVNSGKIDNPTSTLVLSNLPVSNSQGDLSYKIYAKDSLGQQSNTVEGTIVGIDYTIPDKIVSFTIQRSSSDDDFDPDDAGEYLYANIQLQGDDLATKYTSTNGIQISIIMSGISQTFLLGKSTDMQGKDTRYYLPLPSDIEKITTKGFFFLLTRDKKENGVVTEKSVFRPSDGNDVTVSMVIKYKAETGDSWVASGLSASQVLSATAPILTIERDGIALGCGLPASADGTYSVSHPLFLCDMEAEFNKTVWFKGEVWLTTDILFGGKVDFELYDSYIKDENNITHYGWEPITLNSAFTAWNETTDSCQSKRKLDSVSIIGAVKPSANITAGSTTLIATLDKRYAPPHRLQFRACLESTTIEGRIIVAPQYANDGTTVTGTALSFVNRGAAANTNLWISICINYMV